jgi:hypothetical protein
MISPMCEGAYAAGMIAVECKRADERWAEISEAGRL